MNVRSIILTSVTILALTMSISANAKIYKWTDANGQVHYTAHPPAEKNLRQKAKDIEDKIKASAGKYRASKKTKTNVADETSSKTEVDPNLDLQGPSPELVKYCNNQRNNVSQLKKNFRNVWIDVKGNKKTLSQEERQEKVAMIQQKIQQDCSGVPATKKP